MHFRDFPELTSTLKQEILHKDFTVGYYNVNIDEIAAYLDDYDISMKAVRLPTKRFESIINTYETACRYRYNDGIENNFRLVDNKKYIDVVMMYASATHLFDILRDAVKKDIRPPQETEIIKRRNEAIEAIRITNKRLKIEEDIPLLIITFESFIDNDEERARENIRGYAKDDISDDRIRRIYSDIKETAKNIYFDLHKKGFSKDEKINYIYDIQFKQTKNLSDRVEINNEHYTLLDKALNNIVYLEQMHKEYMK